MKTIKELVEQYNITLQSDYIGISTIPWATVEIEENLFKCTLTMGDKSTDLDYYQSLYLSRPSPSLFKQMSHSIFNRDNASSYNDIKQFIEKGEFEPFEPKASSVLMQAICLCPLASECTFPQWCIEFDYPFDSVKSREIYELLRESDQNIREFLGDKYPEFFEVASKEML